VTTAQFLLIDAILTLLEMTPEKELQRRILAILAVTSYCGVKEGKSSRHVRRGRPASLTVVKAAEQARYKSDVEMSRAITSIRTDKRPTIYFLCVGNSALTLRERVVSYTTLGSLSRNFLNKHVKKLNE